MNGDRTKTTTGTTTTRTRALNKNNKSELEPEGYGLSHSLSSESIKRACDFYDDELSDEDLIEVQGTPKGLGSSSSSSQPLSFKMLRNAAAVANDAEEDEDEMQAAFCGSLESPSMSTPMKGKQMQAAGSTVADEALSVLNELDAILDVHGSSDDDKVEDYLMDLDNYLEEMDNEMRRGETTELSLASPQREPRTRTLPLSRKRNKQSKQRERVGQRGQVEQEDEDEEEGEFQRNHQMRKTFSCGLPQQMEKTSKDSLVDLSPALADAWRRLSMRRAMAANQQQEAQEEESTPALTLETPPTLMVNLPPDSMRRCFSQGDCQPPSSMEILTEQRIFDNLLRNEQRTARAASEERPRQFGRRLEGHPRASLASPSRPQSAPVRQTQLEETRHIMAPNSSDLSSAHSSRMASPVSLASASSSGSSSSDSSTMAVTTTTSIDQVELQQTTTCSSTPLEPMDSLRLHQQQQLLQREKSGFNTIWPHSGSRTLALIACTLGVFNLCRFAVLTINYGSNFLLQFLLLSVIFGIPLFWLQMCLGAKIKAGPVSMWKISPICCGVGIALVIVQSFLAIYSTVSVAWILVYLRDVFPSPERNNVYRWQELAFPYRYDAENATGNLTHTVAEYFNIVVLQRLQFARPGTEGSSGVRFHVNDRLAFYLALIWSAVFLILCKGLKSLGKLSYLINTFPLVALAVVTVKFLYVIDPAKLQNIFTASDFDDFLNNSISWTAATQETFLTWGLLGASVIAITSRTHASAGKTSLRWDAIFLVLLTLLGLSLAAILALCCAQILRQNGYKYVPGSFENPESYTAVYSLRASKNPKLFSDPIQRVPHYSSFIGETYRRPLAVMHHESGFQALRFITELFPAVLSLASDSISWVWAAVAFGMFACFGLAQLCVMWKPISIALGNSTSSVLLSCVTGLLLSIPFATEMGISILYYVDFLLGGSWFIPLIWTAQIFGVFLIRGRPYNGDDLVNDLRMCGSMSAFLALSWNVLLPIGLITLSVIDYKTSYSNQFYYWRGKSYFSYWSRKMGSLIQIGILLVIPITAIIQIYRYLTNGPADILERIQLLYRPDESGESRRSSARNRDAQGRRLNSGQDQENGQREEQNDAPPKYTPPPSYTTATGARLAKLLRQSIRRSVRRVLGDSSSRARPILALDAESPTLPATATISAPPDYLTILSHPSGSGTGSQSIHTLTTGSESPESIEIGQRPSSGAYAQRTLSLGRGKLSGGRHSASLHRPASATGTLERARPYTAEDVVTILRSSARHRQRSGGVGGISTLPRQPIMSTHMEDASFRSIENLVLNAEPPDQTPGVEVERPEEDERLGNAQNNTSDL